MLSPSVVAGALPHGKGRIEMDLEVLYGIILGVLIYLIPAILQVGYMRARREDRLVRKIESIRISP